jgi:hypothetical protein
MTVFMGSAGRLEKYVAGAPPGNEPGPKPSSDDSGALRRDIEETFRRRMVLRVLEDMMRGPERQGF